MSTSSRQEAMEGEPVRRHVSDAVIQYNKPVYGMFIAVKIDTNTAETFRHGIWYAKGDVKQRLDIVPLTLAQFQKYFVSMFRANQARPENIRDLILKCKMRRDILDAPAWKQYISVAVEEKIEELLSGKTVLLDNDIPMVSAGAVVHHIGFGDGQVVALTASFPERSEIIQFPYLKGVPDEITFYPDGKTLLHEIFGEGTISSYKIVFKRYIMDLPYPSEFLDGMM